ncbi:hypothetical protein ABT033_31215 [Streptomyces pharetrae]|uniref:hypothetical protein n=1 Tax=Streptomyces pharetrae TaxID=291370 RepID=UPI003357B579
MRRTALAALALSTAAGLTGCLAGEGKTDATPKGPFVGLTGGQILDRAAINTIDAPSLRLSGQMPDLSSSRHGTIRFDIALSGKDECSGTLRYTEGTSHLVLTGGTLYVRYDERFFRAQDVDASAEEMDAAVDRFAGKWVKAPVEDPEVEELRRFCDLERPLGDRHVHSNAKRGETTTIEGTPVIAVREKNENEHITAYVTTKGTPYVIQMESYGGYGQATFLFSDFGKAAAPRKPEGDIIDMATLF